MAVVATALRAQPTVNRAVVIPVEDTARVLATARPAVETPAEAAATEAAGAAIMVAVAAVDPAAAAHVVAAEATLADTGDNRELQPA